VAAVVVSFAAQYRRNRGSLAGDLRCHRCHEHAQSYQHPTLQKPKGGGDLRPALVQLPPVHLAITAHSPDVVKQICDKNDVGPPGCSPLLRQPGGLDHMSRITDWAIKNLERTRQLGHTAFGMVHVSENLYAPGSSPAIPNTGVRPGLGIHGVFGISTRATRTSSRRAPTASKPLPTRLQPCEYPCGAAPLTLQPRTDLPGHSQEAYDTSRPTKLRHRRLRPARAATAASSSGGRSYSLWPPSNPVRIVSALPNTRSTHRASLVGSSSTTPVARRCPSTQSPGRRGSIRSGRTLPFDWSLNGLAPGRTRFDSKYWKKVAPVKGRSSTWPGSR